MITKKSLDQVMKEYDWDKNTTEDTLYFLSFMFNEYGKLEKRDKHEKEQ